MPCLVNIQYSHTPVVSMETCLSDLSSCWTFKVKDVSSKQVVFDLVLQTGWVEHLWRCNRPLSVNNHQGPQARKSITNCSSRQQKTLVAPWSSHRERTEGNSMSIRWDNAGAQEARLTKLPALMKDKWRTIFPSISPMLLQSGQCRKEGTRLKSLSVATYLTCYCTYWSSQRCLLAPS